MEMELTWTQALGRGGKERILCIKGNIGTFSGQIMDENAPGNGCIESGLSGGSDSFMLVQGRCFI